MDHVKDSELNPRVLDACVNCLPAGLAVLLVRFPGDLVVAGGYVRAVVAEEEVSDVDVFVSSNVSLGDVVIHAQQVLPVLHPAHVTKHATTVHTRSTLAGRAWPIQFIDRWPFDVPASLVRQFDYTLSMAAFWHDGHDWRSYADPRFYSDVLERRLTYCSPAREKEEKGEALFRMLKFYRKGYRTDLSSLAEVVARLVADVPEQIDESEHASEFRNRLAKSDVSSDPDSSVLVK